MPTTGSRVRSSALAPDSRLGREQIQTDYALKQIMDSNVAAEWITVEVPALRMTPGRLMRRPPGR